MFLASSVKFEHPTLSLNLALLHTMETVVIPHLSSSAWIDLYLGILQNLQCSLLAPAPCQSHQVAGNTPSPSHLHTSHGISSVLCWELLDFNSRRHQYCRVVDEETYSSVSLGVPPPLNLLTSLFNLLLALSVYLTTSCMPTYKGNMEFTNLNSGLTVGWLPTSATGTGHPTLLHTLPGSRQMCTPTFSVRNSVEFSCAPLGWLPSSGQGALQY